MSELSTKDVPPGFDTLGLDDALLAAIRDVGYESPSPIQLAAIPPLLAGNDLLGQAQTGTGKTAAFALPLLCRLDLKLAQPQVLVLTPTRELAIQVAEAMQTYARHLKGFHVLPVYGGQGMEFQLRQLRRGAHVVVGTPGRVQDHLRRKTLKLEGLRAVVIDEADEMLRMGFIDDVEEILKATPTEKQVALFSATLPDRIRKIAHRHLREPVEVKIKAKTATVASIDQRYVEIRGFDKLEALTRIIETEDFDAMLIFVRTRMATGELAEKLEARGLASATLSGEMTQALRERTIAQLKSGKLDIVVATDVAARGLDVERVTHVVNYDIPHDVEGYIHRIGRTGRAGRAGHAILFVMPRERRMLAAIERATRQPVAAMRLPTYSEVVGRRAAQFKQLITEVLDGRDLKFFRELVSSYAGEHGREPYDIAAALAYLAQKDRPLQPEPSADGPAAASARAAGSASDGSDRTTGAPHRDRERERLGNGERTSDRERRGDRDRAGDRDRRTARRDRDRASGAWVRYRIAVGREHGVQPSNIVGAIANEAGIDAVHIGRIEIFDTHSTVDLPEGMPDETYRTLGRARVCGQKLAITLEGESRDSATRRSTASKKQPGPRLSTASSKPPHKSGLKKPQSPMPPSGRPPSRNTPSGKPSSRKPPSGKPPSGKPPSGKPPSGKPPSRKPQKGGD